MRRRTGWYLVLVVLVVPMALGCARAARNTDGFAITDTATVNVPFDQTWQTAKAVLREGGYDLYTRDKRGVFVAFSAAKHHWVMLHRIKYTVSLESESDSSTKITVESLRQVYGVTLLTYPGWHDRKTEDHAAAQNILKAIEAKAGGAAKAAKSSEPSPEEAGSSAKS